MTVNSDRFAAEFVEVRNDIVLPLLCEGTEEQPRVNFETQEDAEEHFQELLEHCLRFAH